MREQLFKRLWFSYVVALLVWGIMGYVELGKYISKGILFARLDHGRPLTNDFVNMYSAGKLARACLTKPVDVYDIKVQAASVAELTAPVVPDVPFYFQYPPYTFVLALPLSFMPMLAAWLVWDLIGAGLCGLALWIVAKQTFQTPFKRTFAMIAVFGSFPAWLSVQLGQPSLFACAGVTGFFLAVHARRPYLAALCTIPLLVKIQYLPVVGLIGIIMLGLPYAATVAGILAVLLALAALVLGPANVMAFPHALSNETTAGVSGVAPEVMQNLRGVLTHLLEQSPDVVRIVCIVAYLVASAGIVYMWIAMKRKGLLQYREGFAFAASITVLVMLMTSVHTHRQDYLLTAAPCIWLYMCHFQWGATRSAACARWLIVSFSIVSWAFFLFYPLLALNHLGFIQPFFCWALSLYLLSLTNLRKHIDALKSAEPVAEQPEA